MAELRHPLYPPFLDDAPPRYAVSLVVTNGKVASRECIERWDGPAAGETLSRKSHDAAAVRCSV
jgi:hypothetical protein